MDASTIKEFSKTISSLVRQNKFSGAVLIRQGDANLLCRGYGYANRTWKVKNTPETRFRIASVGKMFTAASILQLIDAGKLSLETRVADHLDLQGTKIPEETTIYHLLTMTSGIADWIDEDSDTYDEDWARFCREHPLYLLRCDADYLPIFAYKEPYFKLGEKHRYCNSGFMLLGLIIEKLSGMSYFDYVRKHIFAPSGMTGTDFLDLDDVESNVAEGYIPITGETGAITGWRKNYYATTAGAAADGGTTSTLEDLTRFSLALRNGKLVSMKHVNAMLSPQVIERDGIYLGCQWFYGFGCYVLLDESGNTVRWGHTGEEDGVSCRLWYYPKDNLDVIIMGNQSSCAGELSRKINELLLLK